MADESGSYPLAALVKVRIQEEVERVQAVAEAVRATAEACALVDRLKAESESLRATLAEFTAAADARAGHGASVQDLLADQSYRHRLEADIARADATAQHAEAVARQKQEFEDVARQALAEAAAERKAVETHHERWQAERKRARDRKSQDETDDAAQAVHRRRDK